MKHNLLKSVILSVILLMGVSNAWAEITFSGGYIYFDNSIGINQTYIQLCARQSSWTGVSTLSKINNTKLYYVANPQGSGWGGILGWVVIGNSSQKSNDNFDNWSSYGWCSDWNTYGFNSGSTYLIVPSSTSKSQSVTTSYYSGGYSALNSTQTIKTAVNGADANSKATITVTSYKLTGNGAISAQQSASISTSAKSTTISAARTATTTLTVGSVATGYKFDGWYTAATGGTQLSTSTTYTYYPTAATTVYARFSAKKYNITYKDQGDIAFSGTHASGYPTQHTYGTATTLKTATKTGYTFGGWFTNSGCTGSAITSLGATAYTAAITLYAKWTEKPKYTVTISSDGNGTVTPNTAQVGEIPVSITATPNDGYKFKNWTKTGNVTIENANNASTTITATSAGTVTANFETAKRIYLKPAGDNSWANDNPRYAVYVIDDQTWHNMTKINDGDGNTGNDIYYCDIKPTYQKVIFCRMDPNNATNGWDGIRWTQTEDLTLPDNCNMFDIAKDASTDKNNKASGTWMEYNAWHLAGAFNEWALCGQTFKEQEDGSFTFTQHLELGTYEFKLVHNGEWYGNNGTMVRGTSTGWTMSTSDNNCNITADYAGNYTFIFDASTKKLTVRYPILITLGSSMFGPYGISYNGQSYFSKDDADVVISLPYGATINFIEGQPYSDIYTGGIMQSAPTKVPQLALDQPFTVLSDVTFDDNYVTKVDQVAYLGVPNGCDWDKTTTAANANFTWRFDSNGSFPMTNSKDRATTEPVLVVDNVKYYKFTIPAGCNKFQIQRKQARDDDNNNQNYTFSHTCDHEYMVLNTSINCYMLDNGTFGGNTHTGHWCALPASTGDYRLLYVEQVVEKADGYTVITRKKAHPSDIIRKGTLIDTVSLHTYKDRKYAAKLGDGLDDYESSNNPEIILQKYLGNDQWEDVECQMVYGPLETLPVMGQLPGRKNASPGSDIDDLKYHNGIEIIKQDVLNHPDKGNGVWNFVITQDGAGNASVQWDQTHRYTGEYYIRTDNAEGRWDQYTLNDNYMTYSQYAKDHSGFSHYFCKWVEVSKDDNTKFVIANDYGIAISDTLAQDAYTNEHGDIAHDANIRWSWNMVNNEIARAYIQGTWKAGSQERNRNLVVNYKSSSSAGAVEDLLDDSGDWIYQKDFPVKVGSHLNSLTATYPVTSDKTQTFASNLDMLTGDPANTNEYKVRILYDFKINKTLVALVPDNGKTADIAIDVIIERVDQGPATQVQAQVNATRAEGSTVYAVMSFTKNHINGGASKYAKQFYWISFPFDVRVSDVFGFGEYGKHWIIQWYDGEERAKNGCWVDSPTFWRFQTDTTDYVLEAGKGYVLTLDLAEMDVFTNTNQVSLYFPSRQTVSTVNGDIIHDLNQVTLAPYTCTIQRNDRWIKDSNWHMLGVPSYANKNKLFTQEKVAYFYQYNSENDTYTPTSSGSFNFNSMFSYMVQFAGTINWSQFTFAANGSQGLAAKRNTDNANDKHVLRLELQKNSSFVDQTFVQLQAEEATEMFDMNLDLTKMVNSGNNIYSLIPGTESNIEVAANAMPIAETIIPLGIVSAAAGEYTFAMPEGTDGITVELIDYETNTRTNMLLDEYTVNLGKGTFETRFALHVKPDKTATGVENITTPSHSDVRKFIIDGVLYMQKDGALYDAQGHIVR